MGLDIHQGTQSLFRSIQFHAHVALGNAQHLGHLAIAQFVQVQQHQRRVGFWQLLNRFVKLVDRLALLNLLGTVQTLRGECLNFHERLLSGAA
jgi:hypothetical protein